MISGLKTIPIMRQFQPQESLPTLGYETPHSEVTKEPERCSLYVPCPSDNCDKPGCDGCVSCDRFFNCTREECEIPFPHEIEQGKLF